jgi:hypothetical protein
MLAELNALQLRKSLSLVGVRQNDPTPPSPRPDKKGVICWVWPRYLIDLLIRNFLVEHPSSHINSQQSLLEFRDIPLRLGYLQKFEEQPMFQDGGAAFHMLKR